MVASLGQTIGAFLSKIFKKKKPEPTPTPSPIKTKKPT